MSLYLVFLAIMGALVALSAGGFVALGRYRKRSTARALPISGLVEALTLPPAHPNCRCVVTAPVAEVEPEPLQDTPAWPSPSPSPSLPPLSSFFPGIENAPTIKHPLVPKIREYMRANGLMVREIADKFDLPLADTIAILSGRNIPGPSLVAEIEKKIAPPPPKTSYRDRFYFGIARAAARGMNTTLPPAELERRAAAFLAANRTTIQHVYNRKPKTPVALAAAAVNAALCGNPLADVLDALDFEAHPMKQLDAKLARKSGGKMNASHTDRIVLEYRYAVTALRLTLSDQTRPCLLPATSDFVR